MTNILHINALIEHCNKICNKGRCPLHFNSFNSYCESTDEFGEYPCEYGFAVASMKKQIPKKVDMAKFDIDEFITDDRHLIHICCPICGRALRLFNVKEFCRFNGNIVEPFCSKCGQALYWDK